MEMKIFIFCKLLKKQIIVLYLKTLNSRKGEKKEREKGTRSREKKEGKEGGEKKEGKEGGDKRRRM